MSELTVRTDLSELVRTDCPNWSVRTCPNWTCWFILGPNWSTWFFFIASSLCIVAPPLSHIYLSTTNVEHLGSITFSDMLKLISARSEFTSFCSFLARLHVISPWFIFIGVLSSSTCVTLGMSTSPCFRSLLKPVERLMELVHMVGEVWIFKARWLLNIYFF
jgi:hypothetical protein